MALIICPECSKEFSNRAAACPNYGCPTEIIIHSKKSLTTFDDVFEGNLLSKMNPGAIKKAKSMILENESVLFASNMNISVVPTNGKLSSSFSAKGKASGIFVVTDKRVLFVQSVLGSGDTKQLLKNDITSIDTKNSLMNCPIRIKGISEMIIVDCNKDTQRKILDALNDSQ